MEFFGSDLFPVETKNERLFADLSRSLMPHFGHRSDEKQARPRVNGSAAANLSKQAIDFPHHVRDIVTSLVPMNTH